MDTNKEQSIDEIKISSNKDVDRIRSLLDEYGAKLFRVCDQIEENQTKFNQYFSLALFVFFLLQH